MNLFNQLEELGLGRLMSSGLMEMMLFVVCLEVGLHTARLAGAKKAYHCDHSRIYISRILSLPDEHFLAFHLTSRGFYPFGGPTGTDQDPCGS